LVSTEPLQRFCHDCAGRALIFTSEKGDGRGAEDTSALQGLLTRRRNGVPVRVRPSNYGVAVMLAGLVLPVVTLV
jgi:hypothetical protein